MIGNMESDISAFAFNTGRSIEDLINKEVKDLKINHELLQGYILEFYQILLTQDEYYGVASDISDKYKDWFGIEEHTQGKI